MNWRNPSSLVYMKSVFDICYDVQSNAHKCFQTERREEKKKRTSSPSTLQIVVSNDESRIEKRNMPIGNAWKCVLKRHSRALIFRAHFPFLVNLRLFRYYTPSILYIWIGIRARISAHTQSLRSWVLKWLRVSVLAASLWLAQNQMSTEVNMMKRRSSIDYANDVA